MELERISVVLRPREPREAMDLGTALLRANARAVWSAWFAFTVPAFVLCNAVGVLLDVPWLGLLLMWWLKPMFDRVPLFVLSRAVFDQAPGWRETLRGQFRWSWYSTLAGLTWLRVDSHRALRLPLNLLEGTPRRQRAARWRVLRQRSGLELSLLGFGCLQFELVLFLSVWLLALLLVPREWLPDSPGDFLRHGGHVATTLWTLLAAGVAYLAMSVIEPLYVASGFAFYLNRRTQLEAWDIDLSFRRLRARLLGLGKLLGLVLACGVGWVMPGHAATVEASPAEASTSLSVSPAQVFEQPLDAQDRRFAEAVTEAYRDRRFGSEQKVRRWVPRFKPAGKDTPAASPLLFAGLAGAVAAAFKWLLWGVLAVLLVLLARFAWRQRGRWKSSPDTASPEASATILRPSAIALPDDLAAAVRQLWREGRQREALALLYRGGVEQTAALLQLPPSSDATEADWLRHARTLDDPARAQRMETIVRTWQYAAYAHRYPDEAVVEQLLAGWPAQRGAGA